jgi:hypothetical protein
MDGDWCLLLESNEKPEESERCEEDEKEGDLAAQSCTVVSLPSSNHAEGMCSEKIGQ